MTQIYTRGKDAAVPLTAPPPHKRQQVVRHVRSLAASLTAGDRLPSVTDLERHLGVARKTVVAALDQLQAEGIIEARPRSGTFVSRRALAGNAVPPLPRASRVSATKAVTVFAVSSSPYYRSWVDYLVVQAAAMGIDVQCHYSCGLPDEERVASSLAPEHLGAIILSATQPELFRYVREAGRRAVVISEPRNGFSTYTPYVCSDAEQGGFLAAQYLLGLGHRRIAYVHWMSSNDELFNRLRWRGHVRALREAGLPEPFDVIGADRFAVWREYPEVLRHDMSATNAPTAFVAWSDIEAAALTAALNRAKVQVPEEVSVVGYDNLYESIESQPRLTTFDQDRTTLARRALALLLSPDDYEDTKARQTAADAKNETIPTCAPQIVCRESAGPPRAEL